VSTLHTQDALQKQSFCLILTLRQCQEEHEAVQKVTFLTLIKMYVHCTMYSIRKRIVDKATQFVLYITIFIITTLCHLENGGWET
jgi:hypothetical protein